MKRAAAKPAHSPGPWAIQQHVKHGWFVITADGSEVAGALGLKNALLVSAAPALLSALRDCVAFNDQSGHAAPEIRAARAAIAEATGEAA